MVRNAIQCSGSFSDRSVQNDTYMPSGLNHRVRGAPNRSVAWGLTLNPERGNDEKTPV